MSFSQTSSFVNNA